MFGLPVEVWNLWANRAYIGFGAIAIGATSFALIASFIMWRTSDAIAEAKDKAFAAYQSTAAGEVAQAQGEAAQARRETAELQHDTARLNLALQDARAETNRIRSGLARHVNPAQAALLRSRLQGVAVKVRVLSETAPEPRAFRDDIVAALRAAGIEVVEVAENTAPGNQGTEVYGAPDDPTDIIGRALAEANLGPVSFTPNIGPIVTIRIATNPNHF